MFLFAHVGITAGITKAYDLLVSKGGRGGNCQADAESGAVVLRPQLRFHCSLRGLKANIGSIDYRLVLLGSMLPDLIDKPLWLFASRDIFPGGHCYAHTLLFNLVLLIAGLILARYRGSQLLILALSSFMHLVLDQIWNSPVVLFWPLLGAIPELETAGWWPGMIQGLLSQPEVYVPEIIGLAVVLFLGYRLFVKKGVTDFIKSGSIG